MPRTVSCQASLSTEFSRQENWRGLPFPSPEELPNPGIQPWSPAWQAGSLPFELQEVMAVTLSDISQAQKDDCCPTPLSGGPWRGQVHRDGKQTAGSGAAGGEGGECSAGSECQLGRWNLLETLV